MQIVSRILEAASVTLFFRAAKHWMGYWIEKKVIDFGKYDVNYMRE